MEHGSVNLENEIHRAFLLESERSWSCSGTCLSTLMLSVKIDPGYLWEEKRGSGLERDMQVISILCNC